MTAYTWFSIHFNQARQEVKTCLVVFSSIMLIDRNLVPQIIFVFFVLPKSSKQEKPEDCIAGKQYWSTSFLNPKGTCAPCPHHWRNCDDQPIGDDYQCRISCRGKSLIITMTCFHTCLTFYIVYIYMIYPKWFICAFCDEQYSLEIQATCIPR
jgi:hypothetical protein